MRPVEVRVRVPLAEREHTYGVFVAEGGRALSSAREALSAAQDGVAVVSDRLVEELHGMLLTDSPHLALDAGERAKELDVLGRVLDFCAESALSRSSTLASFGGGTIGDLAGLAGSLFKRGLRVVHVPTTLLAQVDSSVGGKTAINLGAGKNLAGTFHHPSAVYCDTSVLRTLPDEDFASGLGEVVKSALLAGEPELGALEGRADALRRRDEGALADTVRASVELKRRVVEEDPEERGPRRALNLGHTFAHAIERSAGFGAVPHGIAVGVGLALASSAAEHALGVDAGLGARVRALLSHFGLPSSLDDLRSHYRAPLDAASLVEGLAHDKKAAVGLPEFVLLRAPGDVALGVPLDRSLLDQLFA